MSYGLEKYMRFSIDDKLRFTDSFQFLSSSLDSLVKTFANNDFQYLSQEFDPKLLDLVKQKWFYPHDYMSHHERFKKQLPNKEKIYSLLTDRKNSDKEYEHILQVSNKFEIKTMKYYQELYLKCDLLLLINVF